MSESRIIKKYPNRRLYDCSESRYITLQDLRRLVVEQVELKIVEKRTGKDITDGVLLQVVSGQEQSAQALLGKDFLLQLIRFYGGSTTQTVRGYLDESLKRLADEDLVTAAAD